MSQVFKKYLLFFSLVLSIFVVTSPAQAYYYYHCRWVHGHYHHGHWVKGHRVCWRVTCCDGGADYRCTFVRGHWYQGNYYPAQKVCGYP